MFARLLLTTLLLMPAGLVFGQDSGEAVQGARLEGRHITVTGRGTAHGRPDVAVVDLGVTVSDEDARKAVARLDEEITAVMRALAELGVPERNIRTTSFNIWCEECNARREGELGRTLFRAQHMLSVELDGARLASEALAAAVEAGANAVGGIGFRFSRPEELERAAREAAVADAGERARQLAEASGVKLGGVVEVEELAGGQDPGPYYQRSAAVLDEVALAPGELGVEVRVRVRYLVD